MVKKMTHELNKKLNSSIPFSFFFGGSSLFLLYSALLHTQTHSALLHTLLSSSLTKLSPFTHKFVSPPFPIYLATHSHSRNGGNQLLSSRPPPSLSLSLQPPFHCHGLPATRSETFYNP